MTQARPELSWTAAKDNVGVTGYGVYLDAERHEVGTELTRSRYAFCRILISPAGGWGLGMGTTLDSRATWPRLSPR